MNKKLISLIVAVFLLMTVFTGCNTYTENATETEPTDATSEDASSDEEAEVTYKTTVNVSGGVAITLNEFASQASNDYDSFYLLMSGLLRYYDGGIYNDAAESYDVSEDKLVYTFYIREGMTYSDGNTITANDFEYALKNILGPESGSGYAAYYTSIKGAASYGAGEIEWDEVGVKAVDEKTLTIELGQADTAFITTIAMYPFYPVTEEFANEWGEAMGSSPESVLCSGPYTLTDWVLDSSMTYTKNHDWWNAEEEFPLETINIMQIESANTAVSMFENGELDIIGSLSTDYISTIESYVASYESATEMFLWIKESGTSDEATMVLDNDNFRKALVYALDRTAISGAVSAGFLGTSRAVSGNYPTTDGNYIEDYPIDIVAPEGDAELAVEYLNAALSELGYSDVSELPEMTYITFERDDNKLLGETITDTWKQVLGIDNITFVQQPIGAAIQAFYTGEYDLFMISLGCSVKPTEVIDTFAQGGDFEFFTVNWEVDITATLEEANSYEFKSDEYFSKVAEAEEALLNEYSLVPLYNTTVYYALQDGVEGYVEPATVFSFQFNQLTIAE